MSYAKLLDAIILKQKAKKSKPQRRIGDAVFKMIVEMAYEMKYANRHCEAERTNRVPGLPKRWNSRSNGDDHPFDEETTDYARVRMGDVVVRPHMLRNGNFYCRLAKAVRINKKSISLADCDQDGQLIQYNPEDDQDFATKEHRKDYNKLYPHFSHHNRVNIIVGTTHLRYEGWDS